MSLSTTQYGYIVDPMVPFTDDKGKTIKNGFIRVFMAGTSTPVITYRNYDGATNQEKIELDNSGRVKHNVIGSKGSLYKVVVYDAHHSQETPILSVDKIAVLGASINASGATIVTGLDSVTVPEENFLKATVEGTGVELALDPTEVTSEVSTIGAAETAAPDYVVPLLDKTGTGDSKKISLANLFKFALDWISRLTTTVTSFASGDFIAVSNTTNGARKMSKDTLLELTAQNALAGNVAPEFVPNVTNAVSGMPYVHDGVVYVAKEDYFGVWDNTKFSATPMGNVALLSSATETDSDEVKIINIPTIDDGGKQHNVNFFKLLVAIPTSKRQWLNSKSCILFDGYINNSGELVAEINHNRLLTAIFRIRSNTQYVISAPSGINRFTVAAFQSMPVAGDSTNVYAYTGAETSDNRKFFTLNVPTGYSYLAIYFYNINVDTDTPQDILDSIGVSSEGTHSLEQYVFSHYAFDADADDTKVFTDSPSWSTLSAITSQLLLDSNNVTDVTSEFDLDYQQNMWIDSSYNEASSGAEPYGITDYLPVDPDNLYVLYGVNSHSSTYIVVYYDRFKNVISGFLNPNNTPRSFVVPIVPPKGCHYIRVSVNYDESKVYKVSINTQSIKTNVANLLKTISGDMAIVTLNDVTSNYPLLIDANRRINAYGRVVSSSSGRVSSLYQVDYTKKLLVHARVDNYGTCVAWYKDPDGIVLDSIYPLPQAGEYVDVPLIPPLTAKSFRLSSRDTTYKVYTYKYVAGTDTSGIVHDINDLQSDVSELQDSVAELESAAQLSTVIDTVNAVKYVPNFTLYLGSNIFDFNSVSYDPTYWSIDAVNGTITFLGGSTASPLVLDLMLDNAESYLFSARESNYVTLTDMLAASIGDGPKIDTYNGDTYIMQGLVSDGGKLKLWPIKSTNTFTLSLLRLKKRLPTSEGAAETAVLNVNNVNSGNDAATNTNAFWNIAIGPTAHTQSKAVSLTRSIAIGYKAQALLESGWQNVSVGTFAIDMVKNGNRNIAVGCDCLYSVTHADDCIAIGKGALQGNPGQVRWDLPSTWQHLASVIAIGNRAAHVANGQTVSNSVYIGYACGNSGIGNNSTCVGAYITGVGGKTNVIVIGFGAIAEKNDQTVVGNENTVETKVYGDLVVEGTDHVKRKLVFNADNTCSWEVIS